MERFHEILLMAVAFILALFVGSTPLLAQSDQKTTLIYKTVLDVKIAADVYRPTAEGIRPVIVWIHGGALMTGSRNSVPRDLLELATQKNFVLVSIDYRLAPEVRLPEIAVDVRDALHWIHEKGSSLFQADPERVVVVGGSAGGFLTMLAGVMVEPKPCALVSFWGYGDIDGDWTREHSKNHGEPIAESTVVGKLGDKILTNTDIAADQQVRSRYYRFLRQNGRWGGEVTGLDFVKQKDELSRYSPVRNITVRYPPLLMVHGTKDTDVPYQCSLDMVRELKKQGVKHELLTVENAEHGLRDGEVRRVREVRERALAFVVEHLEK